MARVSNKDHRSEVANVAARWRDQYYYGGKWGSLREGDAKSIYAALVALPEDATSVDVARIIGNDSWVGGDCDECDLHVLDTIQLGDEPDYESSTITVCYSCARSYAHAIFALIGTGDE